LPVCFASGFVYYLDRAIVSVALPVIAADLQPGPTAEGVLPQPMAGAGADKRLFA
jgi:hypothetical protein